MTNTNTNTNTNIIKDIMADLIAANSPIEKMGKFERDLLTVNRILSADTITAADRMQLLKILNIAFHEGGKIEGIYSIDSTATNCSYCKAMRAAAKNIIKHICNYCYDYAQEHSFKGKNVLNRHTLNMIILSAVEFTDQELATLNIIGLCRFNSSGDIQSNTMALNYFRIAANNPYCKFALWAKNVAAVKYALSVCGKPENLTLIFSNPIINGRPILPGGYDYTFSVYTPGKIESILSTGDYMECNGKKCKECGYKCYMRLWPAGANIAEKLRANKELIARIDVE